MKALDIYDGSDGEAKPACLQTAVTESQHD